jgi:hypothetical protein
VPPLCAQVEQLLSSGVLSAACPTPFDESMLWRHRDAAEREALRQSLQVAFHNITRLVGLLSITIITRKSSEPHGPDQIIEKNRENLFLTYVVEQKISDIF